MFNKEPYGGWAVTNFSLINKNLGASRYTNTSLLGATEKEIWQSFQACMPGCIIALLDHEDHGIVSKFDETPGNWEFCLSDGIIFPHPYMAGMVSGDDPVIYVSGGDYGGLIHAGIAEITGPRNVIEQFFEKWPTPIEDTSLAIGPALSSERIIVDISQLDSQYHSYCIEGSGFRLIDLIQGQLERLVGRRAFASEADTFELASRTDYWASEAFCQSVGAPGRTNIAATASFMLEDDQIQP